MEYWYQTFNMNYVLFFFCGAEQLNMSGAVKYETQTLPLCARVFINRTTIDIDIQILKTSLQTVIP